VTDVACSRSFSASTAIGSMMASAGSSASVCGFRLTGRRGRCPHGFRAEPVEITERCFHLQARRQRSAASPGSNGTSGGRQGGMRQRLQRRSCRARSRCRAASARVVRRPRRYQSGARDISRVPATCVRESSAASARGIST